MVTSQYDVDELEQSYSSQGYRPRLTLDGLLEEAAAMHGESLALVDGSTRLSYSQLNHQVHQVAAGFLDLGIRAGERVLLQLPNGRSLVVCLMALSRIGALPIMAMPAHRERDICALCHLADPVAYVLPRQFLGFDGMALAERVRRENKGLKHILVEGDPGPWLALDQIIGTPVDISGPSYMDTALLLLSGGTTGTPKLIPRRHTDYVFNALASARVCGFSEATTYLCALPAAHNFPLACPGILGTFGCGGRVVMAQTPGPDETFPLVAQEGVSHTALVPSLARLWVEARSWDGSDLSSLKLLQVGGARLEAELADQISSVLGCRLQQVFGMAEGLLCYTRLDDAPEVVRATQGRPLCTADEVRIVDDDDQPVPVGKAGELQVRGPYTIRGYYRASEHDAVAFTEDGFYRTGDLVRLTEQGNLMVEGRVKEQINRAGEKIAAAEIERLLCDYPGIKECVVVGVADERLGERVCAFLICSGDLPVLAEIQTYLSAAGLPRYKLPEQLVTIENWPLTAIGKIDRSRLREWAARSQDSCTGESEKRVYLWADARVENLPLELLTAIAQSGFSEHYVLYEQPDEVSLALGHAATITVDHTSVSLLQQGRLQRFKAPRLMDAIVAAIGAIDIEDWRAYGVVSFELARALYEEAPVDDSRRLIEIFVPECEIRIRDGQAMLRALDAGDLEKLQQLVAMHDQPGSEQPVATSAISACDELLAYGADSYRMMVANAIDDIKAQRYQKVILSRRIPLPEDVDMPGTYLAGRRHNTPARSFMVQLGQQSMAGFSPETLLEVTRQGWVSTQPLAGTRALGESHEEERHLRDELLCDPKEVAEHAVSVRLAHQELSAVCHAPSVTEFMTVLRRGSVQHLASRVAGQLAPGRTAWDAFEALFPAVTASGIPKRESLAMIMRSEACVRGWYSGCVMLLDCHGAMDAALVLRSIFQQGAKTWLQAGAGIVSQSCPERELEETCEKLACVLRHVVLAPSSTSVNIDEEAVQ